MIRELLNSLIRGLKQESITNVLMGQQVLVVRRLIIGVMSLVVSGSAATLLVSKDVRMTNLILVVSISLAIIGSIALLLLRYGHIIAASILMSIGLHISTIVAIIPYGLSESAVITTSFVIPMILLSYIWGWFGAITSLILTFISYTILLFLESLGFTGWAIRVRVLWVDAGMQLIVLCIIGFIIVYLQSAIILVNQRLEDSQKNLRMFLKKAVHDMWPPVQGLFAAAEELDVFSRNYMSAHLNALRLFVDQQKALIELQEHNIQSSRVQVFVLPVCVASIVSFSRQALEKRVRIHIDCDIDDPCVWGDELAVRRIVDNYLANAVRETEPGFPIVVRIRRVDSFIQIAVIDSGPGMTTEQQKSLFKQSKNEQGGWGIGLVIVRELTTAMSGTYDVISAPGAGSTFWVQLPAGDL